MVHPCMICAKNNEVELSSFLSIIHFIATTIFNGNYYEHLLFLSIFIFQSVVENTNKFPKSLLFQPKSSSKFKLRRFFSESMEWEIAGVRDIFVASRFIKIHF
jgi:hypothetical protein